MQSKCLISYKDQNNYTLTDVNDGEDKLILLWSSFDEMCRYIANHIKNKNYTSYDSMLCSIIRGGLPILTRISHLTNIQNIGIIDYRTRDFNINKPIYMFPNNINDIKNMIILEDILDSGRTINTILQSNRKIKNKNISIYTLFSFNDTELPENIEIFSCIELDRETENYWIEFPWERK